MNIIDTIILGIIEGITEFLPISSTGHLAVASAAMGINKDEYTKLFEIVIQFGAILSVVFLYWRKFFDFSRISLYIKLVVAVVPALVFGALFKKYIDEMLESPMVIAIVMLCGGVLLLFVDQWFNKPTTDRESEINNKQAFTIGCFQVLSILFPGLSRSAATIVGGMQQKLTRRLAAEFSFLLAVPTMFAATVKSLYDVYKSNPELIKDTSHINTLLLGSLIAFVVAMLSIRFLIKYLQKHGFRIFGWYRIIVGAALIILLLTHVIPS
jgi:undecaprenyl-diphosphatase